MRIVGLFFYLFFMITFFLLSKDFGFENWILDPRTGYQFYRSGSGHWYALSILFLSTSFVIFSLYTRRLINLFIVNSFFMFSVYILGSKGFILSFGVFTLILLWLRRARYFKLMALFVLFVVYVLMINNFNPSGVGDFAEYFNSYVNSAMYYQSYFSGEINLYYGYIWLTDFYAYLPRAIFHDKPFVYGVIHINEHFFPGAAEATHTPEFGGPIKAFADFGLIGVVFSTIFNLSNFINILLMYTFYSNLNYEMMKSKLNHFLIFLWIFAPSFMVFFGALYILVIFIAIAIFVSFICRVRLGYCAPATGDQSS